MSLIQMRRLPVFLVAAVFFLANLRFSVAESVQAHHARVELIASQGSAVPGQQLLLGLHFSLEKSWHIYWENPGDSGQPPILQWQLPAGFIAGTIEWPLPEKLKRSSLADYGYQDAATLVIPLRVPSGIQDGTKAKIRVQAKWLICSDVCIPDRASLQISLPVSRGPAPASPQTGLITEARKKLPKPWPGAWKASAISEKNNFTLSVMAGKPIHTAEFFPLVPEQIDNAAPQAAQESRQGIKITLKKSDQLLKPIHVLKGLLVLDTGESYNVAAPVAPGATKAHNH